MLATDLDLPAHAYPRYPRIAPAPATEWLQVPRLLLTLAALMLQRTWQREPSAVRLSRRQLVAEWEA